MKNNLSFFIVFFFLFSCQNKKKAREYFDAASSRLKDYSGQLDSMATYKSIEDYTNAIKYDKTFVAAYIQRAQLYGDIGEYEKAIADVEMAMRYADEDEKVRFKKQLKFFQEEMKRIPVTVENLLGSWYLNKWEMYHTLVFDTSTVFMDNHIDTAFSFSYEIVDKNIIVFRSLYSDEEFRSTISRLTNGELVFEELITLDEPRKYVRTKKDMFYK